LLSIYTGEQTGPGGETFGGIVELGKAHALMGKLIDIWGTDLAPITTQVRPAHVIHTDQYKVGEFRIRNLLFRIAPCQGEKDQK